MKIGIDARLYGVEHTGLGRYVYELVNNILKNDKKNDYVLFLNSKHASDFQNFKRVKTVVTNIPIYSFSEQLVLPMIFTKEKLDLLHIPVFNAPLLYPGKYVLTIHDLIKHDSKGLDTTTRSMWMYFFLRAGYLLLSSLITKRASHIIVPTEFVKKDVTARLRVPAHKVSVTYEAVSGSLKDLVLSEKEKKQTLSKYQLSQPFLVYTGNVYPHKNIDILIDAVCQHNQEKEVDVDLAIICARSIFWERLNKKIQDRGVGEHIKLLGFLDDNEISRLYSLALALVHPSKMEGFGLTGLEAMNVGLPVVSSNASCLPEVYGDAALFFDPNSLDDLVKKINQIIKDSELRTSLAAKGYQQAKKYSWQKMATQTKNIYDKLFTK